MIENAGTNAHGCSEILPKTSPCGSKALKALFYHQPSWNVYINGVLWVVCILTIVKVAILLVNTGHKGD